MAVNAPQWGVPHRRSRSSPRQGIVIDAWVRVSLVGIDLVTVEARIVVASIDTYLKYSEAVGITAPVSRPRELVADTESELERVMKENVELRRRLEQGGA